MSTELTSKDYMDILSFYKLTIPKSKRLIKKKAENIISDKLCRCIKTVQKKLTNNKINTNNNTNTKLSETKAIGICSKTIFNNKGFTRGQFKCKKNRTVKFRHTNKNNNIKVK
jgi:hypothetical protein